jgi:hypothetical protein
MVTGLLCKEQYKSKFNKKREPNYRISFTIVKSYKIGNVITADAPATRCLTFASLFAGQL